MLKGYKSQKFESFLNSYLFLKVTLGFGAEAKKRIRNLLVYIENTH